ncbi:DUF6794 domain-containing protein [Polluticoccus soli]|uniref:DUF6794 domain-containing protein n=1 Tax=Polluticoccus soli TaxID=3034150 RepID=UPI0023E30B87|nr:DUF6794 domain-containing protein [Flavipsychrobacter sp. JY13-12]
MKTALILLLCLFCYAPYTSAQNKLRGQPATLNETFVYLDKIFADDTSLYGFMTMPEYYLPLHYHMSLGQYMRTTWGLASNSRLKRWFITMGVDNPDDMSSIVLVSYHRYLNHQPIDLEGQVRMRQNPGTEAGRTDSTMHFIYDFKELPPQQPLLAQYPVGDTIMIYTAAETQTKMYAGPVSLRAFAVVRAHNNDALLFEITHIENQPNTTTARNVGDLVEGYPCECFHMPPRGWSSNRNGYLPQRLNSP